MSAIAEMETLVERTRETYPDVAEAIPKDTRGQSNETHPLVVVLIAAFIAFNLSVAAIGSILLWFSLRHSGVLAP